MRLRPAAVAAAAALALTLTACSGTTDPGSGTSGDSKTYKIGITQFVQHPSLDLVSQGFKDALKNAGIEATYDEQNAQADIGNTKTIADQFHGNADLDLMLAIATPSAQALVNVEYDRPVLFSAVTDAAAAGLVQDMSKPSGTNVTGASDLNPNSKPVELLKSIMPDAKVVGTIYSSAEANSEVQVKAFEEEAKGVGVEIKRASITNASEMVAALETLKDTDAILIGTDNTVVAALETLLQFGETNQIPVFSADAESVSSGTIATRGISYYDLGVSTGEMAVKILKDGEKPGDMATYIEQSTELKYNPDAAKKMGITLPDSILNDPTAIDVTKQ